MDQSKIDLLVSNVASIRTALDTSPDSWREHTQTVRGMMVSWEFSDTSPDISRKDWQLFVITVFQRVAHADVDHGGSVILDIADWCLKQSVALVQLYPEDVVLLTLIGENWLLRAQKPLLNIHQAEQSSDSSGDCQNVTLSSTERQARAANAALEAKQRLDTADYVEARALLLPAVDYLKRAVDAADAQDKISGALLAKAAEACMSMGNVSSVKANETHFRNALMYLQEANKDTHYTLPDHLQQYLSEHGPVMLG